MCVGGLSGPQSWAVRGVFLSGILEQTGLSLTSASLLPWVMLGGGCDDGRVS